MVSQLLFGETAECIAQDGEFYEIRCGYDGYTGWVQKRQLTPIDAGEAFSGQLVTRNKKVVVNGTLLNISPGSMEPVSGAEGASCSIGPYQISAVLDSNQVHDPFIQKGEEVMYYAGLYLGTSYLWGGKSIWGIDCSGLTQMVYKMAGLVIPRDAYQQAEMGEGIGFLQETRAGDLAFFSNPEGKITHVGLLVDSHHVLHASANVRVDPIDSYGIVHAETGERTHQLRIIKRFF
jgi:gamma-D-glutamyl-L-lysine dipeptidyl-peptidase